MKTLKCCNFKLLRINIRNAVIFLVIRSSVSSLPCNVPGSFTSWNCTKPKTIKNCVAGTIYIHTRSHSNFHSETGRLHCSNAQVIAWTRRSFGTNCSFVCEFSSFPFSLSLCIYFWLLWLLHLPSLFFCMHFFSLTRFRFCANCAHEYWLRARVRVYAVRWLWGSKTKQKEHSKPFCGKGIASIPNSDAESNTRIAYAFASIWLKIPATDTFHSAFFCCPFFEKV